MRAIAETLASGMLYEPPCVPEGTRMILGHEPLLAPGVRGCAYERGGRIEIPIMLAEREGSGDVGRFLDSLSPRCVIHCVISNRLVGMLLRRGWRETIEQIDGEDVDVWVHPKAPARTP